MQQGPLWGSSQSDQMAPATVCRVTRDGILENHGLQDNDNGRRARAAISFLQRHDGLLVRRSSDLTTLA